MDISHDKNIVRNAVGRLARLGDLYDVRTDSFVGFSVLNEPIPDDATEAAKTPASEFNYINTENIVEKFKKLDIGPELRASIVANLVSLEGHAKYLQTEPNNKKARKSLIYSIQTEMERIIFNDESKRCFALRALDVDFATHFVVGIVHGANTIITFEENDYSTGEKRVKINDDLKQELREFEESVFKSKDSISNDCKTWYSVEMFGDILPTGNSPKTGEEALKMLKKLPNLIKMANGGKGKPITYALMPISALDNYLNGTTTAEAVGPLNPNSIFIFTDFMSELMETKLEISDLIYKLETHLYCVPVENLRNLELLKTKVEKEELKSRLKYKKTIMAVRSHNEVCKMFNACAFSSADILNQLKDFDNLLRKIELADKLKLSGVSYVGSDKSQGLDEIKKLSHEVYILFLRSAVDKINIDSWDDNISYFFYLLNQSRTLNLEKSFVAVDLDTRSDLKIDENKDGAHILYIRDGSVVDSNVHAT